MMLCCWLIYISQFPMAFAASLLYLSPRGFSLLIVARICSISSSVKSVSRSPVLLQSRWARGTRNGNHTLSSHPCERNLRHRAASAVRKLLETIANLFICVEVLALELRNWEGHVSIK